MRFIFLLSVAILALGSPLTGLAQQRPGAEGVLRLVDWPERSMAEHGASGRQIERELARHELLPFIDTLRVGYRYERQEDGPRLTVALEWKPGAYGMLDRKRVPYTEMPDSILVTSLVLRADVYARGEQVTEAVIRLDGLRLAASPRVYSSDVPHLAWRDLFVHTPPPAARRIFEGGFDLRNLDILSATFESYGDSDEAMAEYHEPDGRPSRHSDYDVDAITDVFIDLSWLFRPQPWVVDGHVDDDGARHEPRGGDMGRDASGGGERGSGRGSERTQAEPSREEGTTGSADGSKARGHRRKAEADTKDSGDDSDDDDSELLPAALTAVAAVGVLAYAGGTVGYFGNARTAPIGLAAGLVRPSGGFLLQASVNEAVLRGQGEEHLLAKALAFHQVLPTAIQPAIGAGVLVSYANEKYTYEPSLSLGAVANFGPVVLMGAYDVALGGVELSAAFNFRSERSGLDVP
ncbi:MAG TPA: hypothetical protein VFG50_13710 [Rhodothermales bacterium]|nr:hypothetical protein [Rhodothermales bacterium]